MSQYDRYRGWRVHAAKDCKGHCPFHNPSDHHMVDWRINIKHSGLVERLCPDHNTGHPDPDSLDFFEREGTKGYGVHECCGCCSDPKTPT